MTREPGVAREAGSIPPEDLDRALVAGRRALLGHQRADGAWLVWSDMGPIATAQVVVVLRHTGKLSSDDAAAAGRWLLRQQCPDGGFPVHPLARTGGPATTATVWAALRAVGLPADHPAVVRAQAFVEANGGLAPIVARLAVSDPTALFLAMAGVVSAADLPRPAHLFAAFGPLERWLEQRLSVAIPLTALEVGVISHHLRARSRSGVGVSVSDVLLGWEHRRCLELMDSLHNEDGSWFWGDSLHAVLGIAALHAMDIPFDDPRMVRALDWLEGQKRRDGEGIWYSVFQTDVWPTAFALRALLAAGLPADDPAVVRAVAWMVDAQVPFLGRPGARIPWASKVPCVWSFQRRNTTSPDPDDAAVALASIGLWLRQAGRCDLPDALASAAAVAAGRCLRWLGAMQNDDGGWSSLQHNLPSKPRGPIMTGPPSVPGSPLATFWTLLAAPPPELGDPATEDVTGRTLYAYGYNGAALATPAVKKALAFLEGQQMDSGAFWGRWVVNFLAGTAWVVRGLVAAGAGGERLTARALGFMLARQNEDGGWGEDVASYLDPARAGEGPSTPSLTGLVLSALVESGATGPAIERAVRYLLAAQDSEGGWSGANTLHTVLPPFLFYTLPQTELQLPLEALGLYRARDGARPRPPSVEVPRPPRTPDGAWDQGYLQSRLLVADPAADACIAALWNRPDRTSIDDLVAGIVRTDEPLPRGLPDEVSAFFARTAALPPWADQALLDAAAALFERAGWAVATVLYASSLPQLYAFPRGARILTDARGIPDHARRRMLETAQFVFDVTGRDGMAPAGRGVRSCQKVRLIHAGIRHLVRTHGAWESTWGEPISQQHLVATLVTFSAVVLDGLATIGVTVDPREQGAWMHLWNVVGYLLGIEEDLLPRDAADARALFALVRDAGWGASAEGTFLARSTLGLMQELLPAPPQLAERLCAALVRNLAGARCADLLGLPACEWESVIAADRAFLWIEAELGRKVVDGEDIPRLFLRRAGRTLMMSLATLTRAGKQVRFRIPDALVRAWDDEE
jgi:squalene cyclase